MISKTEWLQSGTSLAHACVGSLNGRPIVPVMSVLDILRTHAEPGCGYRIEANGQIHLTFEPPDKAEEATP